MTKDTPHYDKKERLEITVMTFQEPILMFLNTL